MSFKTVFISFDLTLLFMQLPFTIFILFSALHVHTIYNHWVAITDTGIKKDIQVCY